MYTEDDVDRAPQPLHEHGLQTGGVQTAPLQLLAEHSHGHLGGFLAAHGEDSFFGSDRIEAQTREKFPFGGGEPRSYGTRGQQMTLRESGGLNPSAEWRVRGGEGWLWCSRVLVFLYINLLTTLYKQERPSLHWTEFDWSLI